MKRIFPLILIFIATTAFGQEAPKPLFPLVTTNGSAEIKVVPDIADLNFSVTVRDSDFAAARKRQAVRAAKVLAALREAGFENKDIQTSQVLLSTEYSSNRSGETAKINFYEFSQSIHCTLHDISKVPDVTLAVVNAGATGVQNAVLRVTNLRKYRDQARTQAIVAAKEKAQALAAALSCEIGKPHSITEDSCGRGFPGILSATEVFSQNAFSVAPAPELGDGNSPTFVPGMINISASVTVSFELK